MKAPDPIEVPISIITGFLGSGKTTLINHLVSQEAMEATALIINEFGEIGLDHLLIESAIENTLLLENGCICCSIRGDLIDTINDLFSKVQNKQIPKFSRILIETTGLADPAPIVSSIWSERSFTNRCSLDRTITVVDGVHGMAQLGEHEEAVAQIAQADIGLISKSDIAPHSDIDRLMEHLNQINPTVILRLAEKGRVDPEFLFSGHFDQTRYLIRKANHSDHDIEFRHDDIASLALRHESPLEKSKLFSWLSMIYSLRPYAMLRMKGIIWLIDHDRPMLLEAIGNNVSLPRSLPNWPAEKKETQLVLIFKGLSKGSLAESFQRHVLPVNSCES